MLIVGAGSAGSMILKDLLRSPSLGLLGGPDRRRPRQGRAPAARRARPRHPQRPAPAGRRARGRHRAAGHPLGHQRAGARGGRPVRAGQRHPQGAAQRARDLRRPGQRPRHPRPEDRGPPRPPPGRDRPGGGGATCARQRVLVTGAGGSIGSEIARQVAGFGPRRWCCSTTTRPTCTTCRVRRDRGAATSQATVLADIRDRGACNGCSASTGPRSSSTPPPTSTCPMLEDHPARRSTNVLGTRQRGRRRRANGTERFVLISTDKAVHPSASWAPPSGWPSRSCAAPRRPRGAVRGPLRQRARQPRQRDPDLLPPDRPRAGR